MEVECSKSFSESLSKRLTTQRYYTLTPFVSNIQYGLFKETSDRELYPNPNSHLIIVDSLPQFEFLGKILAKAIMEGILVELPFANFFLSKLLGKYNYGIQCYFNSELFSK
jgi:hypothetical protein